MDLRPRRARPPARRRHGGRARTGRSRRRRQALGADAARLPTARRRDGRGPGTCSAPAVLGAALRGARGIRSRWRRFGLPALLPARALARMSFRGERARALFAGSGRALDAAARAGGVRVVRARAPGARPRDRLADAARRLAADRRRARRRTCARSAARSRPAPRRVPRGAAAGAGGPLRRDAAPAPGARRRTGSRPATGVRLERYRYGPGVFKLDWALYGADPVDGAGVSARCVRPPRRHARRDRVVRAGALGRRASRSARSCSSPSRRLFDATRAPAGQHTAWAYCHVPNGWDGDTTERDRGSGRAVRARIPASS